MPLDPFTQTYQTIRTGLLAFPPFASMAEEGNFRDASDPKFTMFRESIASADTPDVMLMNGHFKLNTFGPNSLTTSMQRSYPVIVRHDSGLNVVDVNTLVFYAHIALLRMGDDLGLPFVSDWNITNGMDDPFNMRELKLGSTRYTTGLSINVDMYFDRNKLKNFTL